MKATGSAGGPRRARDDSCTLDAAKSPPAEPGALAYFAAIGSYRLQCTGRRERPFCSTLRSWHMNVLDPLGWAMVLLVLGCGLLVLEVFIPSGGIFGFLATVAVVGSLIMAFRRDTTTGLSFMAVAVFAVPTVLGVAFKYWPRTPMGRAFLGEVPSEDDVKTDDPRRALVGRVGVAQSKMLPSGAVLIDGQYIDAVSQGLAIDPGEPVVVVEVRANRVMVRPARAHEVRTADLRPDDVLSRPLQDFGLDGMDEALN